MNVEDYTLLPLGTKIEKGEIQICSYCGKRGLMEEVDGKRFFTHTQVAGLNEQRQPVIRWDSCPRQQQVPSE